MGIFNWWKKEEKKQYPAEFGITSINEISKMNGIKDDENREIILYIDGNEEVYPYHPSLVENMKKVYSIPIEPEEEDDEEEFEFTELVDFGVNKVVRRK